MVHTPGTSLPAVWFVPTDDKVAYRLLREHDGALVSLESVRIKKTNSLVAGQYQRPKRDRWSSRRGSKSSCCLVPIRVKTVAPHDRTNDTSGALEAAQPPSLSAREAPSCNSHISFDVGGALLDTLAEPIP